MQHALNANKTASHKHSTIQNRQTDLIIVHFWWCVWFMSGLASNTYREVKYCDL